MDPNPPTLLATMLYAVSTVVCALELAVLPPAVGCVLERTVLPPHVALPLLPKRVLVSVCAQELVALLPAGLKRQTNQ